MAHALQEVRLDNHNESFWPYWEDLFVCGSLQFFADGISIQRAALGTSCGTRVSFFITCFQLPWNFQRDQLYFAAISKQVLSCLKISTKSNNQEL